jgi:hypothetical protein
MKRSWIPAALMGALSLGYLAGAGGRGSNGDGPPPPTDLPATSSPVAIPPPVVVTVQPQPIAPYPYPVPVPALPMEPSRFEPPTYPIPKQLTPDDGLAPYPAWNGVDLNCPDVGHPVRVVGGYDPHGLDRDGDGIGCDG